MSRRTLDGLQPEAFMHPRDIASLNAVKKVWGLDTVVRKMNEYGYEKVYRLKYMADNLRVTERTCPKYYKMMVECADILDMNVLPELFIDQTPIVNATTMGVEHPMIVLNSGLIDLMTEDELFAVIAHEMTHVKCNHVLYHTMALFITVASGMLGVAGLILTGLSLALFEWSRNSELSADRGALLAIQDPKVVSNVLMKIAGGSPKIVSQIDYTDFLTQSKEYRELANSTALDKAYTLYNTIFLDHPFPVMRASEIMEWSEGSECVSIILGGRRA